MPATAAKETVFQAEVADQGYATPRVLASGGPDDGVGGRAFMVMTLADGKPLLAGLDGLRALVKLPSLARRLPVTLATVLAELHRLDPAPIERGLDADGVARPGLDTMLESLRSTSDALGRADLAAAATWLQTHRPVDEPVVVCHGDMHPFNVLVDDRGETTVLDWSAATLAPGTYDLGFTSLVVAYPPLVVPQSFDRSSLRRDGPCHDASSAPTNEPPAIASTRRRWHGTRAWSACVRWSRSPAGWPPGRSTGATVIRG